MLFRYMLVCVGMCFDECHEKASSRHSSNIPNTRLLLKPSSLTLRELSLDAERRKFPEG